MRFLASQNQKIGELILVAGFDLALPNLPELDSFTQQKLDYAQLITNIPKCTVIASFDDDVVHYSFTQQLAVNLQAKYIELNGYKHFTECQGVTELPQVLDVIENR
ncbi:MAG: alpha/beta hydrolase [[Actinobacillus] rossii]|nr:alpha/beta hydrolase [[Actinobacillus] rossii]MDY3123312.1 alpha/beta hydrolase [[Actinobacillus] rossii]